MCEDDYEHLHLDVLERIGKNDASQRGSRCVEHDDDCDELTFRWEDDYETYIKMCWNALARVMRVKKVAGGAGKPFRTVARTF